MKSGLMFSMIAALLLFAFQNCGQEYAFATYGLRENRGGATDPGKVAVGPAVWPRSDSAASNSTPLSVSRRAVPFALDFDLNPDYDADSMALSWGNWLALWKSTPVQYHARLGTVKYGFRLDMFKYTVTDLRRDETAYVLNAAEIARIETLFASSILASARQFTATAACSPSDADEYASLETDYGVFDLGDGAPCAFVDLYRNDGSGHDAGLRNFLRKIAMKSK